MSTLGPLWTMASFMIVELKIGEDWVEPGKGGD